MSDSIEKSPIGVDYEQENELTSSTQWMAVWSGAPPSFSTRGDGGGGDAGSDLGRVYSFFWPFLALCATLKAHKKASSTYLHFLDQEIRTIREQMRASMVVLVAFYTNNWHDFWSRTVTREAVTFFQSQKGGGIWLYPHYSITSDIPFFDFNLLCVPDFLERIGTCHDLVVSWAIKSNTTKLCF